MDSENRVGCTLVFAWADDTEREVSGRGVDGFGPLLHGLGLGRRGLASASGKNTPQGGGGVLGTTLRFSRDSCSGRSARHNAQILWAAAMRRGLVSVADMFARRAAASEMQHARKEAKQNIRALTKRKKIEQHTAQSPNEKIRNHSVDVLAEVSAQQIPLSLEDVVDTKRVQLQLPRITHDDKTSTLTVNRAGVSPAMYLGKGKWVNAVNSVLEPAVPVKLAKPGPISRIEKKRIAREQEAATVASASFVVGTLSCAIGAAIACAWLWSRLGRPNSEEFRWHMSAKMPSRMDGLREGRIGQTTDTMSRVAERSFKESASLRELEKGLKKRFG